MMAEVFEEEYERLGDGYVDRLLDRPDFWAIAAFVGDARRRRNHRTHAAADQK